AHRQGAHAETEDETRARAPLTTLLRNPYAALILAAYGLYVFGWYFVDFGFFNRLEQRYGENEARLASFLGTFHALAGIVQLVTQAFLSGWIIGRYGIRSALLALPFFLVLGTGFLTAVGLAGVGFAVVFWAMIAIKLVHMLLAKGLQEPSSRILYQPLPDNQRLALQGVV